MVLNEAIREQTFDDRVVNIATSMLATLTAGAAAVGAAAALAAAAAGGFFYQSPRFLFHAADLCVALRCWAHTGHCAAGLIASGALPPFMIVGIDSPGPFRSQCYLPWPPGERARADDQGGEPPVATALARVGRAHLRTTRR